MFLVQLFLKIIAGARKKQTNHQKINTVLHRGNAKCDGQEQSEKFLDLGTRT